MYAVPTPFAVIVALLALPFVTVATFEFVVDHFKLAAFAYAPLFVFSLIVYFSPLPSVTLVGLVFTLDGAFLTVTLHVAVLPLYVLIVIVAVPTPFAVTVALLALHFVTVATEVFELLQLNPHAYEPLLVLWLIV